MIDVYYEDGVQTLNQINSFSRALAGKNFNQKNLKSCQCTTRYLYFLGTVFAFRTTYSPVLHKFYKMCRVYMDTRTTNSQSATYCHEYSTRLIALGRVHPLIRANHVFAVFALALNRTCAGFNNGFFGPVPPPLANMVKVDVH